METFDSITSDTASNDDLTKTMPEKDRKQDPAITGTSVLHEDIEALGSPMSKTLAQQSQHSREAPTESKPDPNVLADIERFRRMEASLYKHRKEWETHIGPESWNFDYAMLDDDKREEAAGLYLGSQSWDTRGKVTRAERNYERPDIFDPGKFRDVDDERGSFESSVGKDLYDTTIDWGSRRNRLRQTFEKEIDRMFMKEEIQLKALEQKRIDEGKKRRDQPSGSVKEDAAVPSSWQASEATIRWLDWYTFKRLGRASGNIRDVIAVLIGEPIIDDEVSADRVWYRKSTKQVKISRIPTTGQSLGNTMDPAFSPIPERIRVQSDALLRMLAGFVGSEGRSILKLEDMTAIFTRPYKVLNYLEQDLRGWCEFLEKKFEGLSSKGKVPAFIEGPCAVGKNVNARADEAVVSEHLAKHLHIAEDPDGQASEEDSEDDKDVESAIDESSSGLTKSVTALRHLRCLLEFFDSTMVAKRTYLNSHQCRKVFFSDLWQLFRPGLEVIRSDGKQAYRVIGVTSAKHRIAPPWDRWYTSTRRGEIKKTDFSIACVYVDFDGTNIGPVQKEFEIKRFVGQREVTSLEIYPLRFHSMRQTDYSEPEWQQMETVPTPERYRKILINRGARFLDVIRGKHMYYAGSTLDEKEEVESPVVIDFQTVITTRDAQTKPLYNQPGHPTMEYPYDNDLPAMPSEGALWKPRLSALIGMPELEPTIGDDSCSGECCRDEFVYDDQYVDRKQRQEYIESLLPLANARDEQPPITIMPRPLKDLTVSTEGQFLCSDEDLVIMSYRVFGFVLRSRKFAKLDLTYLTEIHASEELVNKTKTSKQGGLVRDENGYEPKSAFDRLVLEAGHGSMIVSLIAQHFRDKKSTTGKREEFDIVRGKGKGLIILLHGAPGVGKTSTAEAVAEMFKKPLFQITCGDLGTTAHEVELALEKNFSLANKWDCILLLDEADVFLTERSKEDFVRNGLVAVFLRLMEYYSGILFLTTNRVGDFDEAFASRIHVSLYYPALNEDKTRQVFQINLDLIEDRFRAKGRIIEIDRMKIAIFAARYFAEHSDARWNGRQIRNACQTALALAEFEAHGEVLQETENHHSVVKLNVNHFEIVGRAYLEFTKYMQKLYGTSASRRAKESKLRAIVLDENDNIVMTQNMGATGRDKKTAFTFASRNPPSHQMGHSPQQNFQQQPDSHYGSFQQQNSGFDAYQPHYQHPQYQARYQPQPQPPQSQYQPHYYQPSYQPQHQSSPSQDPYIKHPENSGAFIPGRQQEGQYQSALPHRQQAPPSPNQQQQVQPHPTWLKENIRDMHAASGRSSDPQTTAGASGFEKHI